jgi:hypothetical protein
MIMLQTKELKRDGDSKKSHHASAELPQTRDGAHPRLWMRALR